jgi:hypothetical protein
MSTKIVLVLSMLGAWLIGMETGASWQHHWDVQRPPKCEWRA